MPQEFIISGLVKINRPTIKVPDGHVTLLNGIQLAFCDQWCMSLISKSNKINFKEITAANGTTIMVPNKKLPGSIHMYEKCLVVNMIKTYLESKNIRQIKRDGLPAGCLVFSGNISDEVLASIQGIGPQTCAVCREVYKYR
ncbi:MAG: hypothetical protein FWC51_01120 [Proteobacteria bacterium]|nr:hypothetical protein [Pseudomonadota bacterium]